MAETKKNNSRKILLLNLIGAVISIIALILILQFLLGRGTRHGEEIAVPDFYGLPLEDASVLAQKNDVILDVTDSVYVTSVAKGAVFSQNPLAGEKVKSGRRILITINAHKAKTVEAPLLVGLSLRGAKTAIIGRGLTVGRLKYVEDMATNYVLEQRCKGRNVRPGTRIEAGSRIDLVLGVNPEEDFTLIPNLKGLSFDEAADMLFENSLNLQSAVYDDSVVSASDSVKAFVYMQRPSYGGGHFGLGTGVEIFMTLDSSKMHQQPVEPADDVDFATDSLLAF